METGFLVVRVTALVRLWEPLWVRIITLHILSSCFLAVPILCNYLFPLHFPRFQSQESNSLKECFSLLFLTSLCFFRIKTEFHSTYHRQASYYPTALCELTKQYMFKTLIQNLTDKTKTDDKFHQVQWCLAPSSLEQNPRKMTKHPISQKTKQRNIKIRNWPQIQCHSFPQSVALYSCLTSLIIPSPISFLSVRIWKLIHHNRSFLLPSFCFIPLL